MWPGQPITAHWGVPDPRPSKATTTAKRKAFADAAHTLLHRIQLFCSLPLARLDALALQTQTRAIGIAQP